MKKHFFLWSLPLIFAICSVVSFRYPGDEYGLWALSSAEGAWIWLVFQAGDIHNPMIPVLTAATGALVMIVPGLLLTKLRVYVKLWFLIFVVCVTAVFICLIAGFPSIEKAIGENSSWQAYIFSSINVGLYLSASLTALVDIALKFTKKVREPQNGNGTDS